jgi:hypothetical protein
MLKAQLANSNQASLHSQPEIQCVPACMFPWSGLITNNVLFRRAGARVIQKLAGWMAASTHNPHSTRRAKSCESLSAEHQKPRFGSFALLLLKSFLPRIMDKKTNSHRARTPPAAKYAQTHTLTAV